jgi:hypothetical protein
LVQDRLVRIVSATLSAQSFDTMVKVSLGPWIAYAVVLKFGRPARHALLALERDFLAADDGGRRLERAERLLRARDREGWCAVDATVRRHCEDPLRTAVGELRRRVRGEVVLAQPDGVGADQLIRHRRRGRRGRCGGRRWRLRTVVIVAAAPCRVSATTAMEMTRRGRTRAS